MHVDAYSASRHTSDPWFGFRSWELTMREYYARTKDEIESDWQPLIEHLTAVATRAKKSAAKFHAAGLGEIAGLWHDIGKYSDEFQSRLRGQRDRVDHSTAGALLALEKARRYATILAYVISGHHGGLLDGQSFGDKNGHILQDRLKKKIPAIHPPDDLLVSPKLTVPDFLPRTPAADSNFAIAFFIRMLFSCLVDADYRDSEAFSSPGKAVWRDAYSPLTALQGRFEKYMEEKTSNRSSQATDIFAWRQSVLARCRQAGAERRGFFSLCVPTGGGKTLSSLAFALEHAKTHNLDRVIYVIPFISIIEQNAKVFKEALGDDAVLEHHSSYTPDAGSGTDSGDPAAECYRETAAAEDWNAPVIVTTAVQFFESLFANKPTRCRKLHNIVNSVIVLDEAQMLPPELLNPTMSALRELVRGYGCSVVLASATQPALEKTGFLKQGLEPGSTCSIIPQDEISRLYKAFERVTIRNAGSLDDSTLAEQLGQNRQVLCIVNTRARAQKVYEALGRGEGHFHLSARMYPAHRRKVLDTIRVRLRAGEVCRVVSTNLIEAGVDVDFPCVYREMAGLDSIAQAAGRCNREGLLEKGGIKTKGLVVVFKPAEGLPEEPFYQRRAESGYKAMERHADILSPEAVKSFFTHYYSIEDLDEKNIDDFFKRSGWDKGFGYLPFESVAKAYRFIGDESIPVIVETGESAALIDALREAADAEALAKTLRALQVFTVSLTGREFAALKAANAMEGIGGTFWVLPKGVAYDSDLGVRADAPCYRNGSDSTF